MFNLIFSRGGSRIMEKRGHSFLLAQNPLLYMPQVAKKADGGGGDSHTLFFSRALATSTTSKFSQKGGGTT